jgi:hypothetical protein
MPQFSSLFEAQAAFDALEASRTLQVSAVECYACGHIPGQAIKIHSPAPSLVNKQPPGKLAAVPRVVKPIAPAAIPINAAPVIPVSASHALHIKRQAEEAAKLKADAQKKLDDLDENDKAAKEAGVALAPRIISFDTFNLLDPSQKMQFVKGGGKVLEEPVGPSSSPGYGQHNAQ